MSEWDWPPTETVRRDFDGVDEYGRALYQQTRRHQTSMHGERRPTLSTPSPASPMTNSGSGPSDWGVASITPTRCAIMTTITRERITGAAGGSDETRLQAIHRMWSRTEEVERDVEVLANNHPELLEERQAGGCDEE